MLYRYQVLTILSLFFVFSLAACSDNTTGVTDDSVATINGSVEGETSPAKVNSADSTMEGTVVTAARITSNGTFETISGTETETDASGQFTVEVDANAANEIVIIAEHSSGELMGFISAEVENNQSYILKPLNNESTAETSIFAEVVSNSNADIVQKSDVEVAIRPEAAAEIQANGSAAAEIAAGLANYAEARAEFFAEFVEENAEASLDQTYELMASAQFDYEANIESASSSDEVETAFETLLDAKLDAYSEAGVDISSRAKLLHMQINALQNTITSVSSDIREEIRSSTSFYAAIAVDIAAQSNADAAGMSDETVSAIADAGLTLRNEIKASSGESSEIDAAFETYHENVRTAIENDSSAEASIIIEIDTEINSSGGAKAVFDNAITGVIDAGSLSDIYLTYSNSVQSNIDSRSDELGDLNADAVAELLIVMNLFS